MRKLSRIHQHHSPLCFPNDNWHFILPVCTTATAYILAFEFDLVMDFMAIFSNKQAEVSTGVTTCDTTVYKVWKHVAWSKHVVELWQYVEHPTGSMSFAWHFLITIQTKINNCHPLPCGGCWNPNRKPNLLSVSIRSTIFVSLIGIFWWYTPVKPCLTAEFNNSRVVCITSNIIIPTDMRF